MSTILITGTSGFIASALAASLSQAHTVLGIGRRDPRLAGVAHVRGDFSQFEDLAQLDKWEIDGVVHLAAVTGGPRRITSISEVLNMEQDTIIMQDIFLFQQKGVGENGKAFGQFLGTGVRPQFMDRLQSAGQSLPVDMFQSRVLGDA